MSKKKRRRARAAKKKQRRKPLTDADLEQIRSIAQKMQINLARATAICREVGKDILNEDRHEFWALVKYVENVQEALVQLDNKNDTILPRLNEFRERSNDRTETTWKSLKGMRSRLAHAFENINHNILWETANNQFPVLEGLLRVLQFGRVTQGKGSWSFKVGLWRRLPVAVPGGRLDGSNSLPAIFFDDRGVAMCVRIGRVADDRIAMHSTADGVSLGSIRLMDPDGEAPPETLWPTSNSSYGVAGGAASFGYHE